MAGGTNGLARRLVRPSGRTIAFAAAAGIVLLLATACGQYGGVHERAERGGTLFSEPVPSVPASGSSEPHGRGSSPSPTAPPPSPPPTTDPSPTVIPRVTDPAITVPGGTAVPGGTRLFRVPSPIKGTITYPQWAALFLDRIQAPVCGNNLISVVAWEQQEHTEAAWNPLATTYAMPGATRFNTVGVRNFTSLDGGLDATVLTLNHGWSTQGYGWIVYYLQHCADPQTTARAINGSGWCAGCAGGSYVVGLIPSATDAYLKAYPLG
jgi:hypothetical protein